MSNDNFGQYFPRPDEMPQGFNGDPEEALAYVRERQVGRYNVEAFYAGLVYFDGWQPKWSALPWVERLLGFFPVAETHGERGPKRDPQALLDIKSLAEAVNGSCLSSAGDHEGGDIVIARAGRCFKPSVPIQAVLDVRLAQIIVNLYRFTEALHLANRGVEVFSSTAGEEIEALRPFCGLQKAMVVRSYVKGASYNYGNAPVARLTEAVTDVSDVLSSTTDEKVLMMATDMLVSLSVCLCFAGLEPIDCPVVPGVRGSKHQAKSDWAHALLACAKSRRLSDESEQVLLESRMSFLDHNMSFEALLLTLDLQFWLIVSGRLWQASTESDLVRELLPAITNEEHREAVCLWLSEVDTMMLSYATAERVLTQVRMIVKPNNLRSLIGR